MKVENFKYYHSCEYPRDAKNRPKNVFILSVWLMKSRANQQRDVRRSHGLCVGVMQLIRKKG